MFRKTLPPKMNNIAPLTNYNFKFSGKLTSGTPLVELSWGEWGLALIYAACYTLLGAYENFCLEP